MEDQSHRETGETDPNQESPTRGQPIDPQKPIPPILQTGVVNTGDSAIHEAQKETKGQQLPKEPPAQPTIVVNIPPQPPQSNNVMNLLTAVIAVFTAINVVVFWLESESTSKQINTLTNKAGGIVDSMNHAFSDNRDALSKAFQANQKALEASERQGREALNASIAMSHNEQRAWVIYPHKYAVADIAANHPVMYSAGFLNTGRTPAEAVEGIVRAEIIASSNDPSLIYEPGTSNIFRLGELFPNDPAPPAQLQARAEHMPIVISAERLARILSGQEYVAIYGQLTYRDIAGSHWMRFCHAASNAEIKEEKEAPKKCQHYNSSGDGEAPPTIR